MLSLWHETEGGIRKLLENYSVEKRCDLLFTGNMFYGPNVDSAIYVIEKTMPIIRLKANSIKLLIAGIDSWQREL